MKFVSNIKKRLSRIRPGSWHYRLREFAFGEKTAHKTRKACPYWWSVPPAFFVGGLKLGAMAVFAIVFLAFMLVAIPIYAGWALFSWFCGYRPKHWFLYPRMNDSSIKMYSNTIYEYKMKPLPEVNNRYKTKEAKYAPWQFGLPLLLLTVFLWLFVVAGESFSSVMESVLPMFLMVVAILGGLALLGFIYRHFVHKRLVRKYKELCPEIEWVEDSNEVAA